MADVTATLKRALGELEAERSRIERQIAGLKAALGESVGARRGRPPGATAVKRRKRKGMSAAQKAAVSKRMKAYWAKRRGGK